MLIDISGFSFSGKSAYYDLLCGSPDIVSFGVEAEFELWRAPGGLFDLYQACCVAWSPVRSSEAIRRFKRLIRYLGGSRTLYDRLTRFGLHYDQLLPDFTKKSDVFLANLIITHWKGVWHFSSFDETHIISIIKKYFEKIGIVKRSEIFLAACESEEFKEFTRIYLQGLFENKLKKKNAALLLNNCFEPFDPCFAMTFFPESRSIIVDRDPRDIYISASNSRKINGADVGGAVVGRGVDSFIDRFLTYRKRVVNTPSEKILRTNFENLILNIDSEISKLSHVLKPLKIDWGHLRLNFDLTRSRKNIRQWLLPENQKYIDDIQKIRIRLPEHCIL